MSQELVTFVILGGAERLKGLSVPQHKKFEEIILSNFEKSELEKQLDNIIAQSKGQLIVLLPPSAFPTKAARDLLKKISLIDQSTWGWFNLKDKKDFFQGLKKVSTIVRSIPNLDQGIYFSKRLYFSIGGIGIFSESPFKEISKRLYTRIDPQKPLPALIIRSKNLDLF